MRWILEVRSGTRHGRRVFVEPGQQLRVGKSPKSELDIPDDDQLRAHHFSFEVTNEGNTIAADGGTTLLNGLPIDRSAARNGDWIRAGASDFLVFAEGAFFDPRAGALIAESELRRDAHRALLALPRRRFALLDSARDRRIGRLLECAAEERQSLYDGPEALLTAEGAPYLVELAGEALAEQLIAAGWGASWGIYLSSSRPFAAVRRHLRRFLMVEVEGGREPVYFRYYDPRVLRTFLASATTDQTSALYEEIDSILLEGARGETMVHGRSP